jgi:hypothetical protein
MSPIDVVKYIASTLPNWGANYVSEDCSLSEDINYLKLSTTDLLVPASMKNAAKCDT